MRFCPTFVVVLFIPAELHIVIAALVKVISETAVSLFFDLGGLQVRTNDVVRVVDQQELALIRTPNMVEVPIELIIKKKTAGAAITLACDTSGLDDKEIYMAFRPPIDAGNFSRIKKGEATLGADRIREFCEIVQNTVYPEWIAYQVGCKLVLIQTEAERQRDEARDALAQKEIENRLLREMLQGRVA